MQTNQAQETASAAVAIALIKPEISADPRILCPAASTCKGWREAVRQCGSCNTAAKVSLDAPLSRLCSFAAWLPQHAALVRSIAFRTPHAAPQTVDGLQWELHLEEAQQLLQQAMQDAYALPAVAATAAERQNTAAAAAVQQQTCLRLPTLSSVTFVGSTGMLASLPAASLTHLNLQELNDAVHAPVAAAALARLSNLQQLRIGVRDGLAKFAYSVLAGVAQLSRLTFLEFGNYYCGSTQQLQQLLAQPLPLRVLRFRSNDIPALDLSQLTQLQELYNPSTRPGVVFPPQLQRLEVEFPWTHFHPDEQALEELLQAVMQLRQLQRLRLNGVGVALPLLHRLTELPALRQLALVYADSHLAAAAAPSWPRLPLCELCVVQGDAPSRRQWKAITCAAAACTALTRLALDPPCHGSAEEFSEDEYECDSEGEYVPPITPFAKLAGLTNLEHLNCGSFGLSTVDALRLTALTRLTHLELRQGFAWGGDDAATAIARSCKQLQYLGLNNCNLVSMACLAEVRHLTQLTQLRLAANKGLTQQGLMSLTGLTGLLDLHVELNAEVTKEVVESFWAALKSEGPLEVKARLLSMDGFFMWRA